jgi:hypothetical protein
MVELFIVWNVYTDKNISLQIWYDLIHHILAVVFHYHSSATCVSSPSHMISFRPTLDFNFHNNYISDPFELLNTYVVNLKHIVHIVTSSY